MREIFRDMALTREQRSEFEQKYRRSGALTKQKLLEYLPALLMTNLSTLLLISVDGLVVGNFAGSDALSSVNIFYPAVLLIGILSVLIANGSATLLSTRMGQGDREGLLYAKSAVKHAMLLSMLVAALAQIPFVFWIIRSYDLSPEMERLTWQYAVGVMISTPFGLGSTVGVCQLQIQGKMKVLMWLSVLEGIVHLLLDLLLVGVLKMGVAGAGYGTAIATVARCAATFLYLAKKTDIYRCGGLKPRPRDLRELLSGGMPEASNSLMRAIQNYIVIRIILSVFGPAGGVIKGVCAFCFNLCNVFTNSVQGATRPMIGLLSGAREKLGMRILMRQSIVMLTILAGALTLLVELLPGLFYTLHGVHEIPSGGLLALRLNGLYFLFAGYDTLFRLYFANRGDTKHATVLTLISNAALPVFAFVLTRFLPGPFLWLSYLLTESILFFLNLQRYRLWLHKDSAEDNSGDKVLYLTVEPEDALDASQQIQRYAEEQGVSSELAYRVGICMEEMAAYAVSSQKAGEIHIQIHVRFTQDGARFVMIDDGRCIALDEGREIRALFTNNYEMLKKISKSMNYQYILNLNYTIVDF